MKSWKLESLGGALRLEDVDVPGVRAGTVFVRMEASLLMSYLKQYVDGKLPVYSPPARPFTPGGNLVGVIEAVGPDVWHLAAGQRVAASPHFVAEENVDSPAQFLLGVTAFGETAKTMQADWPDGTLSEFVLLPASLVTPLNNLQHYSAAQLTFLLRLAVPYGGLLRGRLAPGETVVINGASGAYGSAAVLLALAMGATRVVAAGRNDAALERVVLVGDKRVTSVRLSGDQAEDGGALRTASGGGAHLALDMVGNANNPGATMATLSSLRRGGRLVLMGSMKAELPLSYMQLMANNLELIGNFMHPRDAIRRLATMAASGLLALDAFMPLPFDLTELPAAMEAASQANNLQGAVVTRPATI